MTVARRAGMRHATVAIATNSVGSATVTIGSNGLVPNSRPVMNRLSANESISPKAMPPTVRCSPAAGGWAVCSESRKPTDAPRCSLRDFPDLAKSALESHPDKSAPSRAGNYAFPQQLAELVHIRARELVDVARYQSLDRSFG